MDLAIADNLTKKPKTIDDLPEWARDFKDVFLLRPEDKLPPFRPGLDHEINLKPNAPSVSPTKLIRLPPAHKEVAETLVREDLAAGLIHPSNSPYAAPMFFVPKHDGKLHPVLNYRWVNSHTTRDKYPLPRIDNILDRLQGSEHFTKMDIRWGFKNV
jgi:hypothetical protein